MRALAAQVAGTRGLSPRYTPMGFNDPPEVLHGEDAERLLKLITSDDVVLREFAPFVPTCALTGDPCAKVAADLLVAERAWNEGDESAVTIIRCACAPCVAFRESKR
jgi:hypothetical protein